MISYSSTSETRFEKNL